MVSKRQSHSGNPNLCLYLPRLCYALAILCLELQAWVDPSPGSNLGPHSRQCDVAPGKATSRRARKHGPLVRWWPRRSQWCRRCWFQRCNSSRSRILGPNYWYPVPFQHESHAFRPFRRVDSRFPLAPCFRARKPPQPQNVPVRAAAAWDRTCRKHGARSQVYTCSTDRGATRPSWLNAHTERMSCISKPI